MSGFELLSDAELVALVLGGVAAPLASALVEDGVGVLARAGIDELPQLPGVGRVRARRLAASVELGRRAIMAASLDATSRLPDAVVMWARPRLAVRQRGAIFIGVVLPPREVKRLVDEAAMSLPSVAAPMEARRQRRTYRR